MTLKLQDILSGQRTRRGKEQRDPGVDGLSAGVLEVRHVRVTGFGLESQYLSRNGAGTRTRNTDHPNAAITGWRGDGKNGVFRDVLHHRFIIAPAVRDRKA